MKRFAPVIALLFAALPTVAQPRTAPAPTRFADAVAAARAAVLADLQEKAYPGIAVSISVGGQTVWSEGFGFADLEHRVPMWPTNKFRIGSISKPFTAAAAARLVEEGRLDVDAPVQQYATYFPEKRWPVTTRQLGGHLGGIRHYIDDEFLSAESYPTVESGLAMFSADTLLYQPGSAFTYSSHGWNLISAVVEGAAGMPFLDYMRQTVFGPLGMNDTVADHPDSLIAQRVRFYLHSKNGMLLNAPFVDNSYKWAGGGFLSTPEDLLRFGNAHLGEGFHGAAARELLFTPQRTASGKDTGYGFGWRIETRDDGRRYVSHGGGSVGGTSILVMQPDTEVVLAATINLTDADLGIAERVLDLFVDAAANR